MEIRDNQGNIISDPDLELGYLVIKTEEINHPAVPGKPAKTKQVIVWQDPMDLNNKIVRKVEIEPATNTIPAYVEKKQYQEYIPYTEEELAERELQKKIEEENNKKYQEELKKKEELEAQLKTIPERMTNTETQVEDLAIVLVEIIEGV